MKDPLWIDIAAVAAVAAGGEVGRCCRNISALPMLMLLSPRCTVPLLQGSLDEQLACKRGLENRRIRMRRKREESMGYFWNLEDPASQDEMGLLRRMSRTERKERRRTATPTLTSNTINGDEVSGELTANTLLILGWSFLVIL